MGICPKRENLWRLTGSDDRHDRATLGIFGKTTNLSSSSATRRIETFQTSQEGAPKVGNNVHQWNQNGKIGCILLWRHSHLKYRIAGRRHSRLMASRSLHPRFFVKRKKENRQMSSSHSSQPTFLAIAPRFVVHNLEQALAFYGQLGFQTTYHDEGFAIVERDGVDLHFNRFPDASKEKCSVCWIAVTNSEALYQQYLPTNAVRSPLTAQPWGLKEFTIRDPSGNLIIFAERLAETNANSEEGA